MRILFSTPVLRNPPFGGPQLRIENSIKALSKISELYIYCRTSPEYIGGAKALSFYQDYCKAFFFAPSFVSPHNYIRFLKRLVNYVSGQTIRRRIFKPTVESADKDFGYLLEVADAIQADMIWLGYGNMSYSLLKFIKTHSNYKVVVDTDSVLSRYFLRGLPFAGNDRERERIELEGKAKEEEERWGTKMAEVTTAVSQVDAEYYRSLVGDPTKVHLFSNVVDLATYETVPPLPPNLRNPCIYLAGTFGPESPMDDAARWVIKHVWPFLRRLIPGIHFYIVGTGSKETLSDIHESDITIAGRLFSVLPYLCHSNVALVPLRFESGTRFKILEAAACGIPIVSTTLGAEGIPVTHGKDILIADEPEQFTDSIVQILRDPAFGRRLSVNLKQLVEEKYSIAALADEGRRILGFVVNK